MADSRDLDMKYVVVTGGVISGLGKGITASSIGVLLKSCGLRVTAIKIDPYLNIDAGTMSPFEHGEVFVLDDGGEADLDLGNYERFLDVTLNKDNNITTGKIYKKVIDRERRGDYLGKTVQVVPHVIDEIREWIERVARQPVDGEELPADVCVIELGGTIGDIESMPFVEALRQLQFRVGDDNFCLVFVSLVPVMGSVGELKTKPTQHGVKELRSLGFSPHIIGCRCERPLEQDTTTKLSLFCQVPPENVLSIHDVSNIFRVPLLLNEQRALQVICKKLKIFIPRGMPRMDNWQKIADDWDNTSEVCKIAMVGKYTGLQDSYLSVIKSLEHAAVAAKRRLKILWINAEDLLEPEEEPVEFENRSSPAATTEQKKQSAKELHEEAWAALKEADGILVPGGFGVRGVEGKILAVKYARENKKPFFGICLGLQVAAIEFARNVLGLKDANSAEFDENAPTKVVVYMPEISKTHMGGTMRLGSRKTIFRHPGSMTSKLYGVTDEVYERHRHRYEINPDLVQDLEDAGLKFVGRDETGQRMEILELEGHEYFVATQYHPEFKTRPHRPSPPFLGLLLAASGQLQTWLESRSRYMY